MLPRALSVHIYFSRDCIQQGYFIISETERKSFYRIFHMVRFGYANDWQCMLGNRPCDDYLRYGRFVHLCYPTQCCKQFSHPWQLRIVCHSTRTVLRHQVPGIIFARKCTLFQYHIGKEVHAVLTAIVDDTRILR